MNNQQVAQQFTDLFAEVYKTFHQTWKNKKEMPSLEASAIMLHLTRSGPLTISEAATHFHRSLSAMSEVISRMIKQGWLEKQCDPVDRRTKYIWITAKGEATLKKSSNALDHQRVLKAIERLDHKTKRELLSSLTQLLSITSTTSTTGDK